MTASRLRSLVFSGLLLLSGCRTDAAPGPVSGAPPVQSSEQPPDGWVVYQGEGFLLQHPVGGEVRRFSSHPSELPAIEITGPDRLNPTSHRPRPAFVLWVSHFDNPSRFPLEAWVDSVYRARFDPSRDADDFDQPSRADPVEVAGQRALQLQPFCGDCEPYEVYLARGRHVVVLSYIYDPESLGGTHAEQERIYRQILGSFRWTP